MAHYASLPSTPQAAFTATGISKSEGLKFKDVFSGEQVAKAIGETVPNFRGRIFSPDVTLFAFMHQTLNEDKSLKEAINRVNTDRIVAGE